MRGRPEELIYVKNRWRVLGYFYYMIDTPTRSALSASSPSRGPRLAFPTFVLKPILKRIVRKIAAQNPDMFNRLGPYKSSNFVIDPTNFPFSLVLRPDPDDLLLVACNRNSLPAHEARIAGEFMNLLRLVDCDLDGDALFFSRDLEVTGNTEAVVCLRNALDDVDGSIAESVAEMFGPPGKLALSALRKVEEKSNKIAPKEDK